VADAKVVAKPAAEVLDVAEFATRWLHRRLGRTGENPRAPTGAGSQAGRAVSPVGEKQIAPLITASP